MAIENKYGSSEGDNQLKKYASALEENYPDWTRVLVFLDVYGEAPSEKNWIGLDYEWLVDELTAAEMSPWLGQESKSALKEFRAAIDLNAETFEHIDVTDGSLLEIVNEHHDVINQMSEWHVSREKLPGLAKSVFER